uniref:FAD-binding PCMH-type domain-containing protein n=1 Tax=Quercus lobata TaxID=97700 RepID=A0A7N2LT86_QUELO
MKASTIALLSLFSIFFFPVSWTTSNSVQDKFIKCLDKASLSQPIPAEIYTPNNSSFATALQSYKRNRRFDTPTTLKPAVVVTDAHESNVQATVVCAKKVGIELRIRSGGHDYEGVSYVSQVPFVILDMSNLRSIEIDIENGTAWFQAGAILGAGGHISGGGYGNLLRKYGVATDQVIDAQIVDVRGRILNRKIVGENLFWALRRGGASSFGVILSWKVKLVPVPATVTVFKVNRTLEQGATDIVAQWTQVVDKLPNHLELRLRFYLKGQLSQEYFLKRKSDNVKEPISNTGLEAIWKTMIELEDVAMLWNPYGGVMNEISETAFPHRAGNIFKIQCSTSWMVEGIEATNLYLNKTRKLFEAMTPYVSNNPREAFLNYRDLDIGTSSNGNYEDAKVYRIKYFKGNFHRLARVKTNIDPDNFFRNEQSIPTLPS